MGLVKTRQGDGTRVLDYMQTAGIDIISHLLPRDGQPNLDVLADVFEFRRLYGRMVARFTAERATAEDIAKLEAIAERAALCEEGEELLKIDFEFYIGMTQATHNRVLQLLINSIRPAVLSYSSFFAMFNPPAPVVRKQHRDLIKAFQAREADKAAQIIDTYLKRWSDQLNNLKPQ